MVIPTSSTDGNNSPTNGTFNVSTTVTQTVTTTTADGAQETSAYTSTNVQTVKVIGTADGSGHSAGDEPADPEHNASGTITRVERTEKVIADIPPSNGLNGGPLGSFEIDTGVHGEAVDSAVQQLLSDMLRAGLKPKGPNITPNKAKPNKSVQNTQARLKEARDKGQENADNNVTGKNAGTSDGQSKDKRSKAK
ncbi:hypothetical protein BC629DRAFT_1151307 [Irpex lacteus]|nr:hypothetical protein BC629DRAFT_1151307 [Irpex lacteus]